MTKLNFSKTRIVYWNSNRSTITLPANTSILSANVEILKTDDIVSIPYLVCKVVGNSGTNEGHQWHNIPYNSYGLYCTPCEINTLF